jgi:hypothetical protein
MTRAEWKRHGASDDMADALAESDRVLHALSERLVDHIIARVDADMLGPHRSHDDVGSDVPGGGAT